jgi:uncharacterized protein YcnI
MRLALRLAVVAAMAATTVLAVANPAAAHVTVNPSEATQGGFAKLTFRVPNEKDTAETVKLEVTLPTDTPIASVSVKPVQGWTVQADKTKLDKPIKSDDGEVTEAVTKITWTAAAGSGIKAGQFQEFDISAGPLPEVAQVVFKTLQTYSDGDIVRWIEEPTGGTEPEHPAPVLKLAKKTDPATADTAIASSDTDDSSNGLPIGLGIAGLVAGLAGLVLGLLAYRRAGTRTT